VPEVRPEVEEERAVRIVRLAAVDETEKNFRVWGKVSSRKCLFKIPLLLQLGIVVIVHRTAPATLAVRVVEVLEQPRLQSSGYNYRKKGRYVQPGNTAN
jgi:hypothetical protein